MEKLLIGFADKVITVSDSIAEEYVRLYNIEKPHLVLNCPAYIDVSKNNLFRDNFAIHAEQKIFLYQGALNKGRGIEILLEAFKKLNDSTKVLVIMGYGELEKIVKLEADNSQNIFFQPAVKPEVVLNYTSSADFGVSFIEDSCLSYRYCLPNKMFEYTMAGLPVLVSNLVEMKKFVEEHSVGVVSDENTVNGFYDAFSKIEEFDYESLKSNLKKLEKVIVGSLKRSNF
ncbi:glycosyltransferase [Pseudoalteromonas sp. B160]|uniref:glycosyltransferase n=1 Tax=Pseudoalteromonas sp. B160 TaxID=630414 RepID=UPI00301B96C5